MIEGRLSLATFGLQMQVQALQADDDADIEDGIRESALTLVQHTRMWLIQNV